MKDKSPVQLDCSSVVGRVSGPARRLGEPAYNTMQSNVHAECLNRSEATGRTLSVSLDLEVDQNAAVGDLVGAVQGERHERLAHEEIATNEILVPDFEG